jgi:hypothetical protein
VIRDIMLGRAHAAIGAARCSPALTRGRPLDPAPGRRRRSRR